MNRSDEHKYTPEQIGAYYDGQLTETERLELEKHLKQCPACQAVLTELSMVDSAVQNAECVSAPEGYFQTFGSAVANRIARQKLAPQKEAKRFSWGWITAAAALASLAIVLVSGDLTKPRLYHAVQEEQKTVLLEAPALSQPALGAKDQAPTQSPNSLETVPELNLAEAPAEEASDESPAEQTRKTEAEPEMNIADISMDKEATAAAPAKRAKSMEMASANSPQAAGSALTADKKGRAAKPAAGPAPVKLASVPAQVSPAPSQDSPSSVETVTVIEICLPDGNGECPEPKIRSAIRINLGGI